MVFWVCKRENRSVVYSVAACIGGFFGMIALREQALAWSS